MTIKGIRSAGDTHANTSGAAAGHLFKVRVPERQCAQLLSTLINQHHARAGAAARSRREVRGAWAARLEEHESAPVVSTFVPQVIIIGAVAGLASALCGVLGCLLRKVRFA